MITAGLFDFDIPGMLDSAYAWAVGKVSGLTDPLFGWMTDPFVWWGIRGAAVIAVCVVLAWFFSFKWVKAVLGAIVILVVTFLTGMWQMRKEMAAKAAKKIKRR